MAVAAAVLLTAGCTGESDPDVSPTATADPSTVTSIDTTTGDATTSQTPTTTVFIPVAPQEPPPMPVPEQTPESAVAFLQWWFVMLNYAELTGETDLIRQNSLTECNFCNGQIDRIDAVYSVGGRIERSGDATLSDLSPSPLDIDASVLIEAVGQAPATRFLDADGRVTEESPGAEPASYVIGLEWIDVEWKMRGIADA